MVDFEELIKNITDRVIKELVSEKKSNNKGISSNLDKKNYIPPNNRKKTLITGEEVLNAFKSHHNIQVLTETIITPRAYDLAKEKGVKIIINQHPILNNNSTKLKTIQKIAIGSDHGGFDLKEKLKDYLHNIGYMYKDYGTHSKDSVDYPDIALSVANAVISKECDKGIVINGAGIGSAIAANKVKGILAAVCNDKFTARIAREHDNANIITLGSQIISTLTAKEIIRIFLTTEFAKGRHVKRINKIFKIEKDNQEK